MLENFVNDLQFFSDQTQAQIPFLTKLTLCLLGILILNRFLGGLLFIFGIHPRRLIGLPGIICSPLLHADFNHLFFNLIPLLILSDFVLIHGFEYYVYVTIAITIISGFFVWIFGKSGTHVGASSVITGYWALLVTQIFTEGGLLTIALGIISIYYFATIFFGIFPSEKDVSWEGHLFGFIAGIIVAYLPSIIQSLINALGG